MSLFEMQLSLNRDICIYSGNTDISIYAYHRELIPPWHMNIFYQCTGPGKNVDAIRALASEKMGIFNSARDQDDFRPVFLNSPLIPEKK